MTADKASQEKWHLRLLDMAAQVASWSKDPRCQVGALVVSPDCRQVSWGYNGYPCGVPEEEFGAELKNQLTVHAELNALLNSPTPPRGWTLVSTKFPCADCAKAAIQAGVVRLISAPVDVKSTWAQSQSLAAALFSEVGIDLHLYEVNPATGRSGL